MTYASTAAISRYNGCSAKPPEPFAHLYNSIPRVAVCMPAGSGLESSWKDELQSNSIRLHTHDTGIKLWSIDRQVLHLHFYLGAHRRQIGAIGEDKNTTIGYISGMHNDFTDRRMFKLDARPQLGTHIAAAISASFLLNHRYAPANTRSCQVSP